MPEEGKGKNDEDSIAVQCSDHTDAIASVVAAAGLCRIARLELLFEAAEENAVCSLLGILGAVEARGDLEAAMNHKRLPQHNKVESGHVEFTHLADAVEAVLSEAKMNKLEH